MATVTYPVPSQEPRGIRKFFRNVDVVDTIYIFIGLCGIRNAMKDDVARQTEEQ